LNVIRGVISKRRTINAKIDSTYRRFGIQASDGRYKNGVAIIPLAKVNNFPVPCIYCIDFNTRFL
jgi:hypothetical protein